MLCRISCLLALERFSECVEMIKQELECDDSNPELYVLRARLKLLFGDVSAPRCVCLFVCVCAHACVRVCMCVFLVSSTS